MILLVLILGLVLRLLTINQSLWLDEAISVLASRNLDFWTFVTKYPVGDFHPPLYFGLLWIWTHLFGYSEFVIRLPSVLLGVATIYLTYSIGKKLFNEKIGILAALFLAISPLHLYYSQEARMYSLAAFSVALSFNFFIDLLKGNKSAILPYIFSIALVLYSDYLPYFIIPAQFLFVFFYSRQNFKKFIYCLGGGLLTLTPWFLFILPKQVISGQHTAQNVPQWAKVVGGANLKNLVLVFIKSVIGRVSFANKTVYAILFFPIALLYGVVFAHLLKKIEKNTILLLAWLLLPLLLAFIVSFIIPVLSYFRMIFILPAFYLLLSKGLEDFSRVKKGLILIGIILISIVSVTAYYLNPKFQRENWKGLISFLNYQDPTSSLVLFEDTNLPAPFIYYDFKKIPAQGALKKFPANHNEDLVALEQVVSNKDKIFLVNYLVEISDNKRLVNQKLQQLGLTISRTYDFPTLGFVYEYTR